MDTSFLISLYSLDANSDAAAQTMQGSTGTFLLSALTVIEAINALQLRVFRKEISSAQAKSSNRNLQEDLGRGIFRAVALPDLIFERAREIALERSARLGTRTIDILHVAAAVELGVDYLFSFDLRQRKLAQQLRLKLNQKPRQIH